MSLPIHILSLGAGVQSSTLALMAAAREIGPMPVAAVFADTGDEPPSVYQWLSWLIPRLPFPVITATKGESLSAHILSGIKHRERSSNPPLFTAPIPRTSYETSGEYGVNEGGERGASEGILTRDCTRDFKVTVIQRAVRKIMQDYGAKHCFQWIGISLDEASRMKPSRVQYTTHQWPLIDARMSRHDCLLWMQRNGYPEPPRSACVYCPHHSNAEWRRLKTEEPEAWDKAVAFDAGIRAGLHGVRAKCFVHRSLVPLSEVDLSTDIDHGQGLLWGNECEGMCGV